MWILLYADDISLACDTAEKLSEAVTTMDAIFLRWGTYNQYKEDQSAVCRQNAAELQLQVYSSRCEGINQQWCSALRTWAVLSPLTAPQMLRTQSEVRTRSKYSKWNTASG